MDQWDYLGLVPKGVNADVDAVCWTNHFWFSSSSLTPRITTAWRKHWIRNHCPPLPPNRSMTAIQHKTKKTYSYNQKEIQQQKKTKNTSISRHSNEQTRLIFKLQAITVLLISRFRSQEGSACTNTSGCVILLHSEREKSTQKSQMTSNLIQLWTYCTWFTLF